MWIFLSACTEAELTPGSRTSVRFAPAVAPLDWGAVPFPSDLYRGDDGRIALGGLPSASDGEPLFDAIRGLLATRDGFSTTGIGAFVIDGDLDPSSIPDTTPGTFDDPLLLVDLDEGRAVPLDAQWADDRLVVRPLPGQLLVGGHRHALVATDALRGEDGRPLSPSPAFAAVRDLRPGADGRAVAVLGPALDALEDLGVDRGRVVGLGAYVTGDPARQVRAVRDAVWAAPAARPTVDRVWTADELDELLGVPGEDRPGADVPPAEGIAGTRSVRHDTTAVVVTGTFASPRFVTGTTTDVGVLDLDEDGLPQPTGTEQVPFLLIVPRGADPTNLPVVVAHHGFNASRTTGFVSADTAGAAGFAVLAIDAYQHGSRARSARDEVHAMRGDLQGADGFSEASEIDVSGCVFGLLGVEPDLVMNPEVPLGAFTQFGADLLGTTRAVLDGDWSLVAAADPALAGLAFDPDRIAFLGNSMGAVVGTQLVTAEPELGAAVLDVLPGNVVDTLAESGEFSPLVQGVLLPAIGVPPIFDEVVRKMELDPIIDLYRWALEPIDPLALSPGFGQGPDLLIQLAGHDEVAAPRPSQWAVAAGGVGGVGEFALAPVQPTELPAQVAAYRFDGAMHTMLEEKYTTSVWAEPLVPPLLRSAEDSVVENPIVEIHAQIGTFLESFARDGHAVVAP